MIEAADPSKFSGARNNIPLRFYEEFFILFFIRKKP